MIRPLPSTEHGLRGEIQDLQVRRRYELQRIARESEGAKDRALRRAELARYDWRIAECRKLLNTGRVDR